MDAGLTATGVTYKKKEVNGKMVDDWNSAVNVNPLKVEFASNLKELIDNWNLSAQTWLKYYGKSIFNFFFFLF